LHDVSGYGPESVGFLQNAVNSRQAAINQQVQIQQQAAIAAMYRWKVKSEVGKKWKKSEKKSEKSEKVWKKWKNGISNRFENFSFF